MRRRSIVITLLIILLLLAGGGTGVHFLRQHEEPLAKIGEIESFFHELGASHGWMITGQNASRRAVPTGSGWLEGIGYRRTKEYQEHTYWLANSRQNRLANIKIYREGERIHLIDIFAANRADAEELSGLVLGKFPRLQPILKRYP